jgi:hypothetical protein
MDTLWLLEKKKSSCGRQELKGLSRNCSFLGQFQVLWTARQRSHALNANCYLPIAALRIRSRINKHGTAAQEAALCHPLFKFLFGCNRQDLETDSCPAVRA